MSYMHKLFHFLYLEYTESNFFGWMTTDAVQTTETWSKILPSLNLAAKDWIEFYNSKRTIS